MTAPGQHAARAATAPAPPRPRRLRRWLGRAALFLLVVLAHLIARQWVVRHVEIAAQPPAVKPPVQVVVLNAQPIRREPARPGRGGAAKPDAAAGATPAAAAAPRAHVLQSVTPEMERRAAAAAAAQARARAAAAAARAAAQSAARDAATEAAAEASRAAAARDAAAQAASGTQETASGAAAAATGSAAAAQTAAAASAGQPGSTSSAGAAPHPATSATGLAASHGEQFSLPPAADLRYDTFFNGTRNMPGTISWLTDGQHYDLVISVPLPFVGTYSYLSHGHVDAYGLAPDRYVEQRGTRGHDETTFARASGQITFTRTPNSVALQPGAQDRFSMVFQLASLVRGNPGRYTPGVTRQFFVVDTDSGEQWPVETIGVESVNTANGFVTALHFMRLPRHAGDRRKIDVWLAPSLGYFPVRLVQTEPNGTEVELLLHEAPRRLESLQGDADDTAPAAAPAVTPPASPPSGAPLVSPDGGASDVPASAPAAALPGPAPAAGP